MQPKLIISPETVVPEMVAVVVVLAIVWILSAGVVSSFAQHVHPFVAVEPVAPLMVTTTVQVPVVPDVYLPADPPPIVEETLHPVAVNFVAPIIIGVNVDNLDV